MTSDEIIARLQQRFGNEKVQRVQAEGCPQAHAVIPKEDLLEVGKFLRDEADLDCKFLATVSASDWPAEDGKGHIDVAYVFGSLTKKHRVNVKVRLDRNNPSVKSLVKLFPAANWHEREQYDLLGVNFEQHPDLRRIMMPDDWEGHPLRKDYQQMPEWRGIATSRPKSHDLFRERMALEDSEDGGETPGAGEGTQV